MTTEWTIERWAPVRRGGWRQYLLTEPRQRASADLAPRRPPVGGDVRADPSGADGAPRSDSSRPPGARPQSGHRSPDRYSAHGRRHAVLIDHLGLDKPDLVGYSMGGGVAFLTASMYPIRLASSSGLGEHSTRSRSGRDACPRGPGECCRSRGYEGDPDVPVHEMVAPRPHRFLARFPPPKGPRSDMLS